MIFVHALFDVWIHTNSNYELTFVNQRRFSNKAINVLFFFGEFCDGILSYVVFFKSISIDIIYLVAAGTFKLAVFKEILKEINTPLI